MVGARAPPATEQIATCVVFLLLRSLCCLGVREGLAWRGKGSGGGPRASVPGGVGGRARAPGTPCGVGGGYQPELAWWTGG